MKSLLKYRKILKKIEERELVAVTRQSHYNRFEEEISLLTLSNVIPNQTHIRHSHAYNTRDQQKPYSPPFTE